MGIFSSSHSEVSSGPLYEYGFQKVQRQTKSVIVNILNEFFSSRNKLYGTIVPEVFAVQNVPKKDKKINNMREFPFEERKFPMIVVSIVRAKERKVFVGSDNFLYQEVFENPDGNLVGVDVFAGMADIGIMMAVLTTSPEERSMFAEMIQLCFTHFYRGQFIYKGDDGSLFSIVPAKDEVDSGSETEIKDESSTTIIYATDVGINSLIEYHFRDFATDGLLFEINNIEVEEGSGLLER